MNPTLVLSPASVGVYLDCPLRPQDFIRAEPLDALRTPIRQQAMTACAYLVYPFPLSPLVRCLEISGRASGESIGLCP